MPAGQVAHVYAAAPMARVAVLYIPEGHLSQAMAPAEVEKDPTSHLEHSVTPDIEEYEPGGQKRHLLSEVLVL